MGQFDLKHQTTPAEPPAGYTRLYSKSDGKIYKFPEGGSEEEIGVGTDFADDTFRVSDNADSTKKIAFEASGITTSTTRTVTMPDKNVTLDDAADERPPSAHGAAAHSGAIGTASQISDFDTEVGNNAAVDANTTHSTGDGSDHTDVAANTAARHTRQHALDATADHSALSDNTNFNASITAHGFLPKLSNNASEFLDGEGNWTAVSAGDAERLRFPMRKASAGTIAKGKAVYVVSWNVAGYLEVEAARSDSSSTMPAFAVTNESITNSATGYGILSGDVLNMDTSSWSVGDALYVSSTAAGDLTNTKPTGTNLIQKIAQVARSHATNGQIVVFGAGRSNDVPNIAEGDVWRGNSSGVATPVDLEVYTTRYKFFSDQFEFPNNSDWAVNSLAGSAADTNNAALSVRRFDDTTEQGVGFTIYIPAGATNIILKPISRAETAPGGTRTVGLKLYDRGMPSTVDSWSSGFSMDDIDIPANEQWQYDTETIAISSLTCSAGEVAQFELTRVNPQAGTELSGDWTLLGLMVEFS